MFIRKLFFLGFCSNYWGWFHVLVSAIVSKLCLGVISDLEIIGIVSIGAIIWEFIEFFCECRGRIKQVVSIYGSMERWLYDTIGDILLAVIISIIIIL